MVLTTALRNLKNHGTVIQMSIFGLFARGPLELGVADLAMALSTTFAVSLQKGFMKASWNWERWGWSVQLLLQAVWLSIWVYLPFYRQWEW